MRIKRLTVVLCGFALAALAVAPSASAAGSSGARPVVHYVLGMETAADCGVFALDSNNFCWADDPDGVELGVKFQSSKAVQVSSASGSTASTPTLVTGSLWSTAGGPAIATSTFSSGPSHAWQDLTFSQPVSIVPNQTYIASYHSPNAQYGFQYDYFTNSALTRRADHRAAVGPR